VAAALGYRYIGIDLRPEQVAANIEQIGEVEQRLGRPLQPRPEWRVGDARDLEQLVTEQADFVFTCPPYYDLEVYSEDPRDLSRAGSYQEFLAAMLAILRACTRRLRQDRFAALVISNIRDQRGIYRPLVRDIDLAAEMVGWRLYNDAILVNALGSLPVRTSAQFGGNRKLGRSHQQLLVWIQGDAKRACSVLGRVDEAAVEEEGVAVWLANGRLATTGGKA
jgi:hypothetical protein